MSKIPDEAVRAQLADRLEQLRAAGRLTPELADVVLETCGTTAGDVGVVQPRDWRALREALEAAGRPTPYWALNWSSGRALARAVAGRDLSGQVVLELGSGLGLVAATAARAGATVVAIDSEPEAAFFTALNYEVNDAGGAAVSARFSEAGRALEAATGRATADLVLGADIVYSPRAVDELIATLASVTTAAGEIWIADPGRSGWEKFASRLPADWTIDSALDEEKPQAWVHRLTRVKRSTGEASSHRD